MHDKVCDHNKYGFETCCSYVPNLEAPCDSAIFLSVWSKYINDVIKLKDDEIKRLESDCKTLSAVLPRNVESEKEAVMAFVGFLEEHAKTEVFKRCGLDLEIKFVYIGDVEELAEEFLGGEQNK